MPDKEGSDDEKKSTKSVVNKKQKQLLNQEDYLPEEGYDVARDEGRVRPSKDKKDATTMPVSDEVKKTQKKSKGKSAFEIVKSKYGKAVMDTKKEELDLTKVAEAFGGYIIEAKKRKGRTSLYGNIPPEERGDGSNEKVNQAKADKAMSDASKSGKIDDFTSTTIKGAPNTKILQRDADTGKAIVNPVETSKQTAEKKARVSTAGTGGKKLKNQDKFSTETGFEDATKGKTKTSVTTTKKPVTKTKVTTKVTTPKVTGDVTGVAPDPTPKSDLRKAPTPRVDLRTIKKKTSRKATKKELERTKAQVAATDKRERGKTMQSPSGKGRIQIPRGEGQIRTFKGFKQRTQRSIVKTGKQVQKAVAPVATPVAKFAKSSPLGATIAGIEVAKITPGLKRFFAVKPPLPPAPKGGKVGRRTAG